MYGFDGVPDGLLFVVRLSGVGYVVCVRSWPLIYRGDRDGVDVDAEAWLGVGAARVAGRKKGRRTAVVERAMVENMIDGWA